MKTILILEDNAREMERLVKIVANMELETTIECASNLEQAYHLAMENSIDLFLLDIILEPRCTGDASGVRFADNIRGVDRYRFTPIIFITSTEDPSLLAYSDVRCYRYIEKPYDAEHICSVINEALKFRADDSFMQNMYYRSEGILYRMRKDEIIYIEISRKGRVFHTVSGDTFLSYKSCKEVLKELGSSNFVQCSRYTIVNKNYIQSMDTVNRYLTLKDTEDVLEIGVIYKKSFVRNVLDD